MERTLLCFSSLNGQFKAAGFHKGSISGSWDAPGRVDDFATFGAVAKEAATQTGCAGAPVSLVLAQPRLNDQIVDVPPVKGWALDRFLERRAQQLKTFEGDAAWSSQRALPTKNSEAMLLHLFPKAFMQQLTAGCAEAGSRLVRVIPTTAVLANQLKELPLEKDEVALLAADTGSSTTVVIGRRDGRVCLARVLPNSWNVQSERVAVDLTRTIGFAEQQASITVGSVWLFGPGAAARLAEMQTLLRLAVRPSPVEYTPHYWVTQAAKMPAKEDGNLVSLESRQAPQRKRLITATGMILFVVLLAALGVAGYTEWLHRNDQLLIKKLDAEILRWRQVKADWEKRRADFFRKKELVRIVDQEKPQPVPAWLLAYLGEAAPDDLLLTKLEVRRTNDFWTIRIDGAAQPTTNKAPAEVFRKSFISLTNLLATGPFHLQITQSSAADESAPGGGLSVASRASAREALKPYTFMIEGVIR